MYKILSIIAMSLFEITFIFDYLVKIWNIRTSECLLVHSKWDIRFLAQLKNPIYWPQIFWKICWIKDKILMFGSVFCSNQNWASANKARVCSFFLRGWPIRLLLYRRVIAYGIFLSFIQQCSYFPDAWHCNKSNSTCPGSDTPFKNAYDSSTLPGFHLVDSYFGP